MRNGKTCFMVFLVTRTICRETYGGRLAIPVQATINNDLAEVTRVSPTSLISERLPETDSDLRISRLLAVLEFLIRPRGDHHADFFRRHPSFEH